MGSFAHSGQICISVQRIYVEESIAASFLEKFAAATEKLRIGHPLEETTDISSLITEKEAIRVEEWIAEALRQGAQLLTGGERRFATVKPAILTGVGKLSKLSCQEVFGPVVAVEPYRTLDEAIEKVNDSVYGLQAGIYTRDLERAFQAARRMEVGGVMINDVPTFRVDHMPYGGVKQSGTGREGPRYAIEEMTEPKLICWRV
jgi:acyl-CoA reductase-like NAD-dependent aldehyde dehydrogenase